MRSAHQRVQSGSAYGVVDSRSPHRLLVLLCLVLTAVLSARADAAQSRPNIVFLMTDDQTTYSMGAYDTPGVRTPELDRLARDGVTFDNHYATTAICMASRANVMTGMFEYKTGCNFTTGALLRKHWVRSYPMLLRRAGYVTAFAGKFGFEVTAEPGGKGILPERDFDYWGGGPGQTSYQTAKNRSMARYADRYPHSTLSYAAFASDVIREATRAQRPFCVSISFKAPHRPVEPDPQFDDVYRSAKFTKPANYGRGHGEHFSRQSRQGRQFERFHSWNYSTDYDAVMAKYYQQIFAVDVAIGRIRTALAEAGVASHTIVIFTSDNGFLCGSHGYGSKVLPYEEASRVPLIVFDPTRKRGAARSPSLTGNVDIAPTILELAGLPVPINVDGRSLVSLYEQPDKPHHTDLPLINVWGPAATHSLAVVTRDWKYIYWPWEDGDFIATEELYCTAADPLELRELSRDPEHAESLERLRVTYQRRLEHWREQRTPHHGYPRFDTIFDRAAAWTDKAAAYKRKRE